jgi:hypothetical protein
MSLLRTGQDSPVARSQKDLRTMKLFPSTDVGTLNQFPGMANLVMLMNLLSIGLGSRAAAWLREKKIFHLIDLGT